jgi:hypothetical protein
MKQFGVIHKNFVCRYPILKMHKIKLMSKRGLALIAITTISVAVAVQASSYYQIQAADAQQRLQNNSVRSETIVDGQVKTQDLADDAVTSPKIRNGEVKSDDIEDGTVTSTDMAPGTIPSGGGTPDDNSVTSAKIVDDEVKSVDIGDGEVTSEDVADGTLTSADMAEGTLPSGGGTPDDNSVTSAKIVDGEVKSVDIGTGEVKSVDIGDGEVNRGDLASGAIQLNPHEVRGSTIVVATKNFGQAFADCPAGNFLTGGGFGTQSPDVHIVHSMPFDQNTWQVIGYNDNALNQYSLTASAMCIDPTQP